MNQKIQIQLSIMMFLQFFIWGSWYVTMGTYLNEIGFSGLAIGNAYSIMALAAILSPLFVGMVADKFFNAEKVLGVMHLLGGAFIYWTSTVTDPTVFYYALLLHALCYMPTLALTNAVAFYQMKDPGKEFPAIRVLGTIGWIAAGLLVGWLAVEKTAMPLQIGAAFSVILGIYSFFLPATPPQSKGKKSSVIELLGLNAVVLMKNRSFAIMIISSFLISIPLSFYYGFANLYLNEVGMENAAAKMTLGQMSEIVFMLLIPMLFVRLGVKKMILIGMLAWVLRYILFAYGDNDTMVWMLYGGIILHGICYDFFFVTGQIYVDNRAPESIRANAQGFITLVTYGIGMYVGTIFSGYVAGMYQNADGVYDWFPIWIVPAIIAFAVTILFLVFFQDDNSPIEIEQ